MIHLQSSLLTPRLSLRPPRVEDANAMFANWASDPGVPTFVSWQRHASVEDSARVIREFMDGWERPHGDRVFMIEQREDHEVVGVIGAHRVRGVGIGYVVGPRWAGRGFATEALTAITEAALADPEVWRVWAECAVENAGSSRVLEKAGFDFEGILKRSRRLNGSDVPSDMRSYSRTRT